MVLSSRVRLARNLLGFPFQTTADAASQAAVLDVCQGRIEGSSLGHRLGWFDLRGLATDERELLVERHLISRQHAMGRVGPTPADDTRPRAVALSAADERLTIMVNEEDHLRIQAIRGGLDLGSAFEEVNAADDAIEAGIDYAFSPRLGYLTCCPTNVGTGARLSVMLHLPGLRLIEELDKVRRAADDMGLAVRGFYGEGSEAAGDLYQVSNQVTLGKAERVLLQEIEREIVPRIVDYERHARRELTERRRTWCEDKVHRALGTLRSARLLDGNEAMSLLSLVRLGVLLGMVSDVEQRAVNGLMLAVQPAHLARASGRAVVGRGLDQLARREARAKLARARLGNG